MFVQVNKCIKDYDEDEVLLSQLIKLILSLVYQVFRTLRNTPRVPRFKFLLKGKSH